MGSTVAPGALLKFKLALQSGNFYISNSDEESCGEGAYSATTNVRGVEPTGADSVLKRRFVKHTKQIFSVKCRPTIHYILKAFFGQRLRRC